MNLVARLLARLFDYGIVLFARGPLADRPVGVDGLKLATNFYSNQSRCFDAHEAFYSAHTPLRTFRPLDLQLARFYRAPFECNLALIDQVAAEMRCEASIADVWRLLTMVSGEMLCVQAKQFALSLLLLQYVKRNL